MKTYPSRLFAQCTETVVFRDANGNLASVKDASTVSIIVTNKDGKRVYELHRKIRPE